jgi:hypothetical protein
MTTPILNGAFARGLAGGEYIGLADGDRTLSAAQYRGPEGAGLKHHFFIAGEIFFSNLVGTFSTHALTVARNPDRDPDYTIDGDAADFLAEDDGDEFSLVYDGTSNWVVRV